MKGTSYMRIHLLLSLTSLVLITSMPLAWAGGDLPFPFDGQTTAKVIERQLWRAEGLDLVVQMQVYANEKRQPWGKIWLRHGDGTVEDRIWVDQVTSEVDTAVKLDTRSGRLYLNRQNSFTSFIQVDGISFRLVPQP